jgi:hypothetical protein
VPYIGRLSSGSERLYVATGFAGWGWNSAERSWDCLCHGSRFRYDGKVIQGPANEDLEPREI